MLSKNSDGDCPISVISRFSINAKIHIMKRSENILTSECKLEFKGAISNKTKEEK